MSVLVISLLILLWPNLICSVEKNHAPKLNDRITGGYLCGLTDTPFIAYLRTETMHAPSDVSARMCGGSLISSKWILTAGHCIDPEIFPKKQTITAILGSKNHSSHGIARKITKAVRHPDYSSITASHDIALLLMGKPIENRVIPYAKFVKKKGYSDKCTKGLTAGWGLEKEYPQVIPPALKCAPMTLVSKEKCTFGSGVAAFRAELDGTRIYGLIQRTGDDACRGDSGGPLVCDGFLIGIVSAGDTCGQPEYCSLFVKIESYFKFIKDETGLNLPEWTPQDIEYSGNKTTAAAETESTAAAATVGPTSKKSSANNAAPSARVSVVALGVLSVVIFKM